MKNSLKIIFVLILMIIVLIFCLIFKSKDDEITFYLIGNQQVFIGLGEQYYDLGFVATNSKEENLEQYVKVKSYINNNQVGTYVIKYVLTYNDFSKEISRIVRVVENVNDNYYLFLNGDKNEKYLLGEIYYDEGCIFYDKNANQISTNISVSGSVNTQSVGNYELIYSTKYNGINYEISRNVLVYDYKVDYIITNENNGKRISFYANDEYFNNVKLPDGTINDTNTFYYIVKENGVYNFEFYDVYENKKNIQVNITDIVSDLKCDGVIDRNGTSLSVTGTDKNKFNAFEWYFNGIKNNSSTLSYKKSTTAHVIAKNDNQSIKIDCNIKNNLIYDFNYNLDTLKPLMQCKTYNENDKVVLEEKLKNSILEAGYGTRAGVVEAARFIVGVLEYRIPYLGPKKIDSSLGRYAKVGLNIANKNAWGCMVSGWTQGIDCTNFVSWAFIQAGLKLQNVYGSSNVYKIKDVVDRVRVGDLVLTPNGSSFSHVGIIVGIDINNFYVVEASGSKGTILTKLSKNNLPNSGNLSKVKLYNYNQEGNLTNMWVS